MKINNLLVAGIVESEEQHFSWSGCENCSNGLGNTVYDCKVFTITESGKVDPEHYELQLCGQCLCAYHNGGDLGEECKNIYYI